MSVWAWVGIAFGALVLLAIAISIAAYPRDNSF